MFTGVRVRTRDEPRIREHLVVRCPHRLVLARPAAIHDLSSVSSTQVPLPLACPAAPPFRDPPPLRSYIQHLRETERRSERENYAIGQVRKRERGEDKRAAKRRRGMRRAQCLPGTSAGLTSSPRRGPTGSWQWGDIHYQRAVHSFASFRPERNFPLAKSANSADHQRFLHYSTLYSPLRQSIFSLYFLGGGVTNSSVEDE